MSPHIGDAHEITAKSFPDDLGAHGARPALVDGQELVTYAELAARASRLGERLGATRRLVALEAVPTVASITALVAALQGRHPILLLPAGGVPGNPLLDVYDPDVVLAESTGWEPVERHRGTVHTLHPDLALLLSTSGSTGSAKVVRLSLDGLRTNAQAIAAYLELTADDRAMTTLPWHYCYGLSVITSHLAVGASVALTGLSVVDPCFWDQFRSVGATGFAGVPYTFELLDRVGFDEMALPTLRWVTQAGGRLAPEQVRRYAELGAGRGWRFYVMYGQTEATARMAYLPPELAMTRPEAIGVAIPGGVLDIDPIGADPDEGELVYRGPNVMLGYATRPNDLAEGRTVHELRTGDLGRRSPDGVFEITGRRSRLVKPFGIRVDLDHLEQLLAAGGVTALVAGDDANLLLAVTGEADRAGAVDLVAAHTGLTTSRVRAVVVDNLPRLPNGKPDHAAVLALAPATAAVSPAVPEPSRSRVDAVLAALAEAIGRPVGLDETFVSAGGDSLSYVEVSVRVENALGTLPTAWHLQPIRDLLQTRARGQRRWLHRIETTVALRAVAIVLIVGTHARAWEVVGGAHLLLGIAGYNFARFRLATGSAWRTVRRIAVPSICWIALVAAVSDRYAWPEALLVSGLVGREHTNWAYWFVETLVQILVVVGAALAIPAVRRAERRAPFVAALTVTAVALAIRFDLFGDFSDAHRTYRAYEVLWLFALGWAGALARNNRHRIVVSLLIAVAAHGFFGDPRRETLIILGLLATIWLPTLRVVAPLHRVAASVASASLWIYLCSWQVYPPIARTVGPLAAVMASVVAGLVAHQVYEAGEAGVASGVAARRSRLSRLVSTADVSTRVPSG